MSDIAVIIPAYKVEKYICKCIESVINQTAYNYGIFIIDDGSIDHCAEYCDQYAAQYECVQVIHQMNGGLSAARNAGMDLAFMFEQYEWITFLDSDDWLLPEFLDHFYTYVVSNGLKLCACSLMIETNETTFPYYEETVTCEIITPTDFWTDKRNLAAISCAKMFHRTIINDIRFPIGLLHEDEYTTYKWLFSQEKVGLLMEPLYVHFASENSIMRSQWTPRRLDGLWAVENQMLFFKEKGYSKVLKSTVNNHEILLTNNLTNAKKYQCSDSLRGDIRKRIGVFASEYYGNPFWNTKIGTSIYIGGIYVLRYCKIYTLALKNKFMHLLKK